MDEMVEVWFLEELKKEIKRKSREYVREHQYRWDDEDVEMETRARLKVIAAKLADLAFEE